LEILAGVRMRAASFRRTMFTATLPFRHRVGMARKSDRDAIAEKLMILVVAAFTGTQIGIVVHELHGLDPLDHLEADFVLAT
jgi:hypothetical protein